MKTMTMIPGRPTSTHFASLKGKENILANHFVRYGSRTATINNSREQIMKDAENFTMGKPR